MVVDVGCGEDVARPVVLFTSARRRRGDARAVMARRQRQKIVAKMRATVKMAVKVSKGRATMMLQMRAWWVKGPSSWTELRKRAG
jgi:hypothetical protein